VLVGLVSRALRPLTNERRQHKIRRHAAHRNQAERPLPGAWLAHNRTPGDHVPRIRLIVVSVVIGGLALASTGCASASVTPGLSSAPTATQSPAEGPTSTPAASPSTVPSASSASGATVNLTEWKISVDGTVKPGKTDLTMNNVGTVPHELLIFKSDRDPSAYPTDAAGDIEEDGAGVTLVSDGENIDPGGSQTRSVDLAPGKYLFVCNIPGHFKAGMFTAVTVAP
jgi:uncharacterized cupredoxin-like copper-binding protein